MILRTGNKRRTNRGAAPSTGFTLVEMLSYVAPSLSRFFRGRNLTSEARRLLALTRYGQSRAVSEGIPMLLWVDPRQGQYGLKAQTGYIDPDPKAVEYTLTSDMQIQVQNPVRLQTNHWTLAPQSTRLSQPTICFLPDGFISESSPDSILLRAPKENDAVWIGESANRLRYEIRTNLPAYAHY
jgi:Tfp pilus assembly protein FimT